MGIYIPGVEMPETGSYVVGVDNIKGRDITVTVWKEKEQGLGLFYAAGIYKAVNVPQHGRLIDADALYEDCALNHGYEVMATTSRINEYMQLEIDAAPTIIPASGGTEDE